MKSDINSCPRKQNSYGIRGGTTNFSDDMCWYAVNQCVRR